MCNWSYLRKRSMADLYIGRDWVDLFVNMFSISFLLWCAVVAAFLIGCDHIGGITGTRFWHLDLVAVETEAVERPHPIWAKSMWEQVVWVTYQTHGNSRSSILPSSWSVYLPGNFSADGMKHVEKLDIYPIVVAYDSQ